MFLKIIILAPLILTLLLQSATYYNENNSINVYAQKNSSLVDFSFAAAGDWGCNGNSKNTVNNIINKNPELILGLGDYSYRPNATCWFRIVDPIDDKMKIVIGNHDAYKYVKGKGIQRAPERLQQYMDHFNLSKQYYSFDYQNVHFVAMSLEIPFGVKSQQYSSPSVAKPIDKFRDTYHPLFEKYRVDIVIQAHSHNYQRTFPINYNAKNSSNPIISDRNITDYSDTEGQIFTVVGTGGVAIIHNFTGPPTASTAVRFNGYGFLNVSVLRNGTMLIGEFHDNDDTVKDRFSITKSNNSENKSFVSSQSNPRLMSDPDGKFKIETIFKGLRSPTDMAFLDPNDPNDIIVLEKNNGTVQRIVNSQLEKQLLDVNVLNKSERGLLATAISQSKNGSKYVYLYYTEANAKSHNCPKPDYCLPGIEPVGNRLYRYELTQDGSRLINPKLILDLPAVPGPGHNGGKITFGPDNNIFLVIGDLMGLKTKAQNYENGEEPNSTGGVLRIDQEGHPLDDGILGKEYPLNLYYAYGIRNSFGIDFDPVTGNLWDTENGPDFADEINLVKPGFNSGWKDVQGIWEQKAGKPQNVLLIPDNLANFNGKGKYSSPEFTFFKTIGVTAIKFFNSDKMGEEYKYDLFVGDFKNGKIYHFDLNDDRTILLLDGELADKIANSPNELEKVTFAKGFSGITDLEVGPDGYLYALSIGQGAIYRIVPK